MYFLYRKTNISADATRYELLEKGISLFGCNKGMIPWLLSLQLESGQEEPCQWHIDILAGLNKQPDFLNSTLLIDLTPKRKKLSLYEITDVWGYSSYNWTPVLLCLNGIFIDEDPLKFDRQSFDRKNADVYAPIYEFLYLTGSVGDGKLRGTWVPPPATPTNSALLFPSALNYFLKCIKKKSPEVYA